MESAKTQQLLNDYFSCSYCCKIVTAPYVLPCGEIICDHCIVELRDSETLDGLFTCKSCTQCFREIPEVCRPLHAFLEDLKATSEPNEDNLQCSICLDILWKPASLSCGHWLCFWCLERATNRDSNCPLCRKEIYFKPKIVKKLHKFIIEYFPHSLSRGAESEVAELEQRLTHDVDASERTRDALLTRVAQSLTMNLSVRDMSKYRWPSLGCDGCGVCPIVGETVYCCKNCMVAVGFDLCEACHKNHQNNPSKIVGLYEQEHDPETHEFIQITPQMLIQHVAQRGNSNQCPLQ